MRRFAPAILLLASAAGLLAVANRGDAQGDDKNWGTIKGRIVWGGEKAPTPKRITVPVDKDHCLGANPTADKNNGTILDESLVVDPKTKGIKNVFVYLLVDENTKLP